MSSVSRASLTSPSSLHRQMGKRGYARDAALAHAWALRAAEQGHAPAQHMLATAFKRGDAGRERLE